jgi:hypothetical protein
MPIMKTIHLIYPVLLLIASCDAEKNKSDNRGAPVIIQKQKSITGSCIYTYEGYGREEWFEDDCDKYEVGDTLKGAASKK